MNRSLFTHLCLVAFIGLMVLDSHGNEARARGGGFQSPMTGLRQDGDTIDVSDDHGGSVGQYDGMWANLAAQGKSVRVVGPCQSACTTLLGHVPRARICVMPEASFGFHRARTAYGTATMWNGYPADIRAWIDAQGGLSAEFKWMRAPDTFRYFKRCTG